MAFSRAVNSPRRWWNWNTKPMVSLRKLASSGGEKRVMSVSPNRICPRVGRSRVPRQCSRVDLPAPEAPMIVTISPGIRVRLTSRSTGRTRAPWVNSLNM
jgi:hypothetical protein